MNTIKKKIDTRIDGMRPEYFCRDMFTEMNDNEKKKAFKMFKMVEPTAYFNDLFLHGITGYRISPISRWNRFMNIFRKHKKRPSITHISVNEAMDVIY
jgi:hypothetical protein